MTADLIINGTLTPGMARDLQRLRDWERDKGQVPTAREWAAAFNIHPMSADAALCRLAAAGFASPRRPHRYDDRPNGHSPAELEVRLVRELLREADAMLAVVCIVDRPRRDGWRQRAAAYLAPAATP
jgi:hypothetical protein